MRAPSIIQEKQECFLTGDTRGLDCHHIYFGGDRKTSDENGFWIWLRHDYHIADSHHKTPHNDRELDLALKRMCQLRYEETHTREEFMKLIGRNYLED